jgi:hypothetical protein
MHWKLCAKKERTETSIAACRLQGTIRHGKLFYSNGNIQPVVQAKNAGSNFEWQLGTVNSLGCYAIAGGRSVTIHWEWVGITSQHGHITDDHREIFKLAFVTTGRIAILSDLSDEEACYDYRFLEAVR